MCGARSRNRKAAVECGLLQDRRKTPGQRSRHGTLAIHGAQSSRRRGEGDTVEEIEPTRLFVAHTTQQLAQREGCVGLHFPAVAKGELLRRVRAIVGPDLPLTISLDPHANVTATMVRMPALESVEVTKRRRRRASPSRAVVEEGSSCKTCSNCVAARARSPSQMVCNACNTFMRARGAHQIENGIDNRLADRQTMLDGAQDQPADLELRRSILEHRLARFASPTGVPSDVIEFLARTINRNVREMKSRVDLSGLDELAKGGK